MPRMVSRTEELPKIPLGGFIMPTAVTAGATVIFPAGQHPRMRLIRFGLTAGALGS